jgi:hypothetical protein
MAGGNCSNFKKNGKNANGKREAGAQQMAKREFSVFPRGQNLTLFAPKLGDQGSGSASRWRLITGSKYRHSILLKLMSKSELFFLGSISLFLTFFVFRLVWFNYRDFISILCFTSI